MRWPDRTITEGEQAELFRRLREADGLDPGRRKKLLERPGSRYAVTRERLATENVRLAVVAARRAVWLSPWQRDDAESVGLLTLLRAVDAYDPDRGARFSTYLARSVRSAVRGYFDRHGWQVYVPGHAATRARAVLKARAAGRPDPPDPRGHAAAALAVWGAGGGSSYADGLEAAADARVDEADGAAARSRRLAARLAALPERERYVIERRYGDEPWTLTQVGAGLGLTKERVRQIEKQALARLGAEPDARP